MIKNGADIEARTDMGFTPLYTASMFGKKSLSLFIIKLIKIKSNFFFAAGQEKVGEVLIKSGANVNSRDNRGQSVLYPAATAGIYKLHFIFGPFSQASSLSSVLGPSQTSSK